MATDLVSSADFDIADILGAGIKISDIRHPDYTGMCDDWYKWRLTYKAGDSFIERYLEKLSTREDTTDFINRKRMSYVPAFAKAAVNEVKDSIFQRISDVTRKGDSLTYERATKGLDGGVDLAGTTMNSYIGRYLLDELLVMSKVGVFIDMPPINGPTLMDQYNSRPYIYHYRTEDILNWDTEHRTETVFTKLLLKENVYKKDLATGLPTELVERYRFLWVQDDRVLVHFFDEDSRPIDRFGMEGIDVLEINLPYIPFVKFDIMDSLLTDVANYQIALLNLASSDIAYALKSNFPFYLEQFDPRVDNLYSRPVGHESLDGVNIIKPGERDDSVAAKNYEIEVGSMTGRRVPKGLEMPRYIHPSSEPLKASMAKQEELKKDIRMLVKLAVANLSPKMASAESKNFDERSLEAGLSAIGLELEHGERMIAKFWQMYEDSNANPPTVKYPQKYSLQSDKEKRQEAKDLHDSLKSNPSLTYKKEAYKLISETYVGSRIAQETRDKINEEIDKAEVIYSEWEELNRDVELTLIDPETASLAKGYPEGSVAKANIAHAERVKRIAESQAKARGTTDLGGLENVGRAEKIEKDTEEVAKEKTRGNAN